MSSKLSGLTRLVDPTGYYLCSKIVKEWLMRGGTRDTLVSKLLQVISEENAMSRTEKLGFIDVYVEHIGGMVTKIQKAGVVIWPAEPHTAGTEPMIGRSTDRAAQIKAIMEYDESARKKANDGMVGGNHYRIPDAEGKCPHCRKAIQHWDWAYNLRGLEYAATKYIARWRAKGGLESLKKAIHYIQKIIEINFPWATVTITIHEQPGKDKARNDAELAAAHTNSECIQTNAKREAESCTGMDGLKSEDPHAWMVAGKRVKTKDDRF
jgi:hypothetical protein